MQPVIVRQSLIHGVGVFAAREFYQGEEILLLDDSRIVDDGHPLRSEHGEHERHCDYLANGLVVLMGEPERYINSSCDPNVHVRTQSDGVRVLLAMRPIALGDEIVFDYILNCHGGIVWQCNCGSPRCRQTVPSSFFDLPRDAQRRYLPFLDDWFIVEHRERIDGLTTPCQPS